MRYTFLPWRQKGENKDRWVTLMGKEWCYGYEALIELGYDVLLELYVFGLTPLGPQMVEIWAEDSPLQLAEFYTFAYYSNHDLYLSVER